MFKVLVVDDEYYVTTLIRYLVDWEKFGMEVVGEAYDGLEALEKIQTLRPEIVVVDVCMPEIDGITLIQRMRQISSDIRFIVISGHKKFEYAKSVIQYNVEDYLLKPIDKEEFEAILKKLRDKLKEEWIIEQKQQTKDRQLRETTRQLREHFIKLLLERRIDWEEENLLSLQENYHVDLSNEIYKFVLIKLDVEIQEASRDFIEDSLKKIKGYLRESWQTLGFEMVFAREKSRIACLMKLPKNAAFRMAGILPRCLRK